MCAVDRQVSGPVTQSSSFVQKLVQSFDGRREKVDVPPRNRALVSLCEATHCSRASALHTLLLAAAVNCEGLSSG